MKRVIIAGVGPGSKSCLTEEVKEAIDNSEVLIGSKRLIEEDILCSNSKRHNRYY